MANDKPYILTLSSVVQRVKSLGFPPLLGGKRADLKLARERIPLPAFLQWTGLPVTRNQPCWFCPPNAHSRDTNLCVFRHKDDDHWLISVANCWVHSMDVSDIWEWLVRICLNRLPYPQWDKFSAALDLLSRQQEFDQSIKLRSSPAPVGRRGEKSRPGKADELTLNHRELVAYVKTLKIKCPGSIRLPRAVEVRPEKVLSGYFPEEGHIWIGSKFNWGETRRLSDWLGRVSEVQNWQYFVPNYLKPFRRRSRTAILARQWIVVEADKWTLEQQYWIHRKLSEFLWLACLCWSGGKSLHGSYGCSGLRESDLLKFYQRAAELGVNDMSAYFPEQPVRFPGGWNKKTKKWQSIYVWDMET